MDTPGEFYYDNPRNEILYVYDPIDPICSASASASASATGGGGAGCEGIVPVVDNLISIGAVSGVTLRDLVVSHGGDGGEEVFTGYGGGTAGFVTLSSGTQDVTITRCDLRRGGANGIVGNAGGNAGASPAALPSGSSAELPRVKTAAAAATAAAGGGLRGVTITECTIEDLGAEGISIIDPLAADVLIADCVIGETGVEPTLQ